MTFTHSAAVITHASEALRAESYNKHVSQMKSRTRRGYNKAIDKHRPKLLESPGKGKKGKGKKGGKVVRPRSPQTEGGEGKGGNNELDQEEGEGGLQDSYTIEWKAEGEKMMKKKKKKKKKKKPKSRLSSPVMFSGSKTMGAMDQVALLHKMKSSTPPSSTSDLLLRTLPPSTSQAKEDDDELLEVKVHRKNRLKTGMAMKLLGKMGGSSRRTTSRLGAPGAAPTVPDLTRPMDVTSAELHAVKWVVLRETYIDKLAGLTDRWGTEMRGGRRDVGATFDGLLGLLRKVTQEVIESIMHWKILKMEIEGEEGGR